MYLPGMAIHMATGEAGRVYGISHFSYVCFRSCGGLDNKHGEVKADLSENER